ncbi:transporter substrate-binding domain-containing protein [Pseudomonas sp. MMS21-TM103]|uniref:substrate-binding periplasmic protein n=1 Tax=Pseudomonas sp. MMS21 TM103 TaxID=2886506 RepID=UPI001EDE7C4E|nr:transporter substrate-binding domain-containing protein [Pseudomonas sp. MMS21 TM103]MCG4452544.1 transporter substrate-binding domain-containing protein [Pseudomonas sp. MMS21 TM103]
MPLFHRQLIAALLFACLSLAAQGQPLRIVSEAWPPYIHTENGVLRGLDYETTQIVLQRLDVEVEWQLLPWRRCLMALEQGQADGILGIFHTPEREASMLFPGEPLSQIDFVLFYAKANPHPFQHLTDLRGLKVGVSAGYWYSNRDFRESTLFTRESAPSHAANFGKLVRKRVDLVINDRRSGHFILAQTGLEEQIRHHPQVISRNPLYLGLRRNAGHDELAQRFASELRRFKQEPAYAALKARYNSPDRPRRAAQPPSKTANH